MEKHRNLRIIGNILLVLSLGVCWVTGGAVAYGWIAHADHYGAAFRGYGIGALIGLGLLTLGTVLCFCRLRLSAAIVGTAGFLPAMGILLRAMRLAEENSWSGQTAQSFGRQASAVWRNGMAPMLFPYLLLMLLALSAYFSYAERSARAEKRRQRDEQPAPSILGGEDDAKNRREAAGSPSNRQKP